MRMNLKKSTISKDRRAATRQAYGIEEEVRAVLRCGTASASGKLRYISKNVMGISIDDLSERVLDCLSQGAIEAELTRVQTGTSFVLSNLEIKRRVPDAAGHPVIYVTVHDHAAKTLLWTLVHDVVPSQPRSARERIVDSEELKVPCRGHYTEKARQERASFIRKHSGLALDRLDSIELVPDRLSSNIENLIGSVEIPVGLVGPLQFNGKHAQGIMYAPFATTEGALVASATRGATAITRSGGVTTRVIFQQMIRVPVFSFSNLAGALAFAQWVIDFFDEIRAQTRKVSRFATLVELEPIVSGCNVNVRFIYQTGDAAGQNMTTTCTWHACMWILENLKSVPLMNIEHFMIEANLSGDKKVNYMSYIKGRGTRVIAECFVHEEDLKRTLKVGPAELVKAYHLMSQGAHNNGMIGVNINVSNTVAAIFTATGQDIACVHESSLAVLNVEAVDGGVYASMLMPSLIIGTVGGGTSLPDQRQYLEVIDCAGANQVFKLAEVIAGFCLALDLSTLSALANGQFAMAHEKLGRNRPVKYLEEAELNLDFFRAILAKAPRPLKGPPTAYRALPMHDDKNSIVTDFTKRRLNKLLGLFPYEFSFADQEPIKIMLKIKPLDSEVTLMLNSLASMCQPTLANLFRKNYAITGFMQCHRRELAVYRQTDDRFLKYTPRCYGMLEDASREIYLLALENLDHCSLMNTVNTPEVWQGSPIEAVISGLAELHAIWWRRDHELRQLDWIGHEFTAASMVQLTELWQNLVMHAAREFSEWFDQDAISTISELISAIPHFWGELEKMPKTLVHNDFNPRNIGLRESQHGYQLCAYDWELATIHIPQHDLAEFLIFTQDPSCTLAELTHYVDRHHECLMRATNDQVSILEFRRGFVYSLMDLMVNRVPMYIMAHTLHHYKFTQRITATGLGMLRTLRPWLG